MKAYLSKYIALIVLLLAGNAVLAQQSIVASPEKTTMLLGEPLKVTIIISGGQAYTPDIPDSLGHFEILEVMPALSSDHNGNFVTKQELVITSFDSGSVRIPPIGVKENPLVVSPGVDIMVNTLPPDSKVEYGDIKQIIEPKAPAQWPYIAALSLISIGSAFMIWRLTKKQQLAVYDTKPDEVVVTPGGILQQMDLLKKQWTNQEIHSLQLGNSLIELLKKHLATKGIYSSSKTGDELILATRHRIDTGTWQNMAQAIRLCNAMRFGKYEATQEEGLEGIDAIREAIRNQHQREKYTPEASSFLPKAKFNS